MTTFTYRNYNVVFVGVFLAPFVLLCLYFVPVILNDGYWLGAVVATLGAIYLGWSSTAWLFAYRNARVTIDEGQVTETSPFGRQKTVNLTRGCEIKTRTMMEGPLRLIYKVTVTTRDGSSASFNSLINEYSDLKSAVAKFAIDQS